MRLRSVVRRGIERLTGAHVIRTLPHGVDLFADIKARLPATPITTIFDVGANVGQSAHAYRKAFPSAKLYCFEPVQATFDQLKASLQGEANVTCFRLALSGTSGSGEIAVGQYSDLASLKAPSADTTRTVTVPVETLDDFCRTQGIEHIGLLKVDTEGGDLDVLAGGKRLLAEQRFDIIEVEAGMSPRNIRHVPFHEFTAYLGARQYFLFGIYDQMHEWPTHEPNLRRVNPVFISERVIKANIA